MSIGDIMVGSALTYRQLLIAAALRGLTSNPGMVGINSDHVATIAVCVADNVIARIDKPELMDSGEDTGG